MTRDAPPNKPEDSAPPDAPETAPAPAARPEDALIDPALIPTEFHPNRFKLWLAATAQIGIAGFVMYSMTQTPPQAAADGAEPAGQGLVFGVCLFLICVGLLLIREARDARPLLTVTPEGLEDRRQGFIPWADISHWRAKNSIFAKYFGYSLNKGVRPPRNALIMTLQGGMNALGGRPQRVFMKHMMVFGPDVMALSCRQVAAEKEKV